MHACIHAYMHTCIHASMHAYMHTCIHAYIHAHMHTCIHAYMHTCIQAFIHPYITLHYLTLPYITLHTYTRIVTYGYWTCPIYNDSIEIKFLPSCRLTVQAVDAEDGIAAAAGVTFEQRTTSLIMDRMRFKAGWCSRLVCVSAWWFLEILCFFDGLNDFWGWLVFFPLWFLIETRSFTNLLLRDVLRM